MIESDKKEFAVAVHEVLKSYGQECQKFTLELWWFGLKKHSLECVVNAMYEYCASPEKCRYPPKSGDIIAMIEGSKADRKEMAVIAFARMFDNLNTQASAVFDDPAIHYAIMVGFGSWEKVGAYNETKFECQEQRRAFIAAYTLFSSETPYLSRLVGLEERENAANGYHNYVPRVLYIGNKERALQVELQGRSSHALSGGQEAFSKLGVVASSIVKGNPDLCEVVPLKKLKG